MGNKIKMMNIITAATHNSLSSMNCCNITTHLCHYIYLVFFFQIYTFELTPLRIIYGVCEYVMNCTWPNCDAHRTSHNAPAIARWIAIYLTSMLRCIYLELLFIVDSSLQSIITIFLFIIHAFWEHHTQFDVVYHREGCTASTLRLLHGSLK